MYLTARNTYTSAHESWAKYLEFVGISKLTEVRTIDHSLNELIDGSEGIHCDAESFEEALSELPKLPSSSHYIQLAVNLTDEPNPTIPSKASLLGYDLADETEISSLLNCGAWESRLADFAKRLNEFGLLTLEDAREAQRLLPLEWGEEEGHAFVDIWAIYQVEA